MSHASRHTTDWKWRITCSAHGSNDEVFLCRSQVRIIHKKVLFLWKGKTYFAQNLWSDLPYKIIRNIQLRWSTFTDMLSQSCHFSLIKCVLQRTTRTRNVLFIFSCGISTYSFCNICYILSHSTRIVQKHLKTSLYWWMPIWSLNLLKLLITQNIIKVCSHGANTLRIFQQWIARSMLQ